MTEHVCEWIVRIAKDGRVFAECIKIDCDARLSAYDIDDRLTEYETLKKATERLSAEDARAWCEVEAHIWGGDIPRACASLRAYADILEPFTGGTVGAYFDTSRPEQEQDDETE